MRKLFTTREVLKGRLVTLYEDTWMEHVTLDHPEVASYLEDVQRTIESPNIVYRSGVRPDSEISITMGDHGQYPSAFLSVAVLYEKSTEGIVRTAHFARKIEDLNVGKLLYLKRT